MVDTHWGVAVDDPYRFLENTGDPDVQKLMRAQADATAAILAKIPARDRLLARLKEIDSETPARVTAIRRDERGGLFYLKRGPAENQFKLYRRDKPDGAEALLYDPEIESKAQGSPHAIGDFTPSHDGRLVAYSVSAGGGEIGTLRVIDTATLKEVTPTIDRIRGGDVTWLDDASGFFYSRLAEGYESRPRAERFMDHRTFLRRLDQPASDAAVFGPGVHASVTLDRSASGYVFTIPGQPLIAALVFHGVDRNRSMYLADRAALLEGKPRWRKVFDQADQVESVEIGNGFVYVKTAKGAPRYQLLRMALPAADLAKAESVIAPGDAVIGQIGGAKDALYVTRREGVVKKLYRVAYAADAKLEPIALPVEGLVDLSDVNPRLEGAILESSGWTRAPAHYALAARATKPVMLGLVPVGKFDAPEGLSAREVRVRSHDGVEVPVSVISRADVKLDGRNPLMLYAYGAYGSVEEPAWSPRLLAWFERGGILAIAHVRGGGIFGDAWHRAGWKTTKPNTWKDGIAAAEWLIAQGYTSRERLSVYGGSAGGVFVGRAITERPDLFASAAIVVGNVDSLRSETRANGAVNTPEYGTVTKEDEFRGLLAMSPYANVKAGTAYPAVILEHGVNDTRVDVWMTLKMGSRLAAATSSAKPVLMRLEYDAGHGPGGTRDQAQRSTADRWSFFLWQAGVAEFQPDGGAAVNR
jgi:prolyl oligopeptidase